MVEEGRRLKGKERKKKKQEGSLLICMPDMDFDVGVHRSGGKMRPYEVVDDIPTNKHRAVVLVIVFG